MVYFKEEQRFNQWWMWAIILPTVAFMLGLFLLKFHQWFIQEEQIPDDIPIEYRVLIIVFALIITIAVVYGIFIAKLETQIKNAAIHYRFIPFIFKWRKIKPEEIVAWKVRKYNAITEYGGWGVRFTFGSSRAVNVKGNQGLQLHLKSGKKLLIGTQKPSEIKNVMEQLMDDKKKSHG